ncbi:hypothetical protein HDZ31DRAFT_30684 [Schizophyllum fasciatum]
MSTSPSPEGCAYVGDTIDPEHGKAPLQSTARSASPANDSPPIHQLPSELLADIFDYTVPPTWYPHYAGRHTLNFPQVCASWRAVAHTCMSHLWADIRVHVEHSPRAWGAAVARYLARSQPRPLSVTLDFTIDPNPFCESDVWPRIAWSPAAWDLLCAQSARWAAVRLDAVPRAAYDRPPVRCPLLARLSLGLEDTARVPTEFFADAQAVRALAVSLEDKPAVFAVPSAWQLTRLVIMDRIVPTAGTFGACADALRACSGTLTYLAVDVMVFGEWEGPPVSLDALRTLYLARGAVEPIARYLTVPNIHTLTLYAGWGSPRQGELDALALMVQRSDGLQALRTLYLRAMKADGNAILRCLALLPSVTTLTLDVHAQTTMQEHITIASGLWQRARDPGSLPNGPSRLLVAFRVLPNLTALAIVFGYEKRHYWNPMLSTVIRHMLERRATDPLYGRLLKTFDTDLIGDWPVPSAFSEGEWVEFPVPSL